MIGSILALLAAISFALTDIFLRRAVLKVSDASIGTLISVPMALPFLIFILVFTGQLQSIFNFSWQSCVWFSLAGIFDFVIGRSLIYKCVQLAGANIASILRRVNIPVAVVIGISVLQEPLSWQLVLGILLILTGITLAGLNPQGLQTVDGRRTRIPAKAFVFGLGCGVAWGISPIFIKLGLESSDTPIAGTFISFLAATAVLSLSLLNPKRRTAVFDINRSIAGLFCLAGLLSCTANLVRYFALELAPASVVTPLIACSPVFLLVLSFLFNRRLEIFGRSVIMGIVMVVIGSILLV